MFQVLISNIHGAHFAQLHMCMCSFAGFKREKSWRHSMHFLVQPTGHPTLQLARLGHLDGVRLNAEHIVAYPRHGTTAVTTAE